MPFFYMLPTKRVNAGICLHVPWLAKQTNIIRSSMTYWLPACSLHSQSDFQDWETSRESKVLLTFVISSEQSHIGKRISPGSTRWTIGLRCRWRLSAEHQRHQRLGLLSILLWLVERDNHILTLLTGQSSTASRSLFHNTQTAFCQVNHCIDWI